MSKASRDAKRKAKALRKQSKIDNKLAKNLGKYDMKLAKRLDNNDRKEANATTRGSTRQTAYANGIDPNAWISDTVEHVGDTVSSFSGGSGRDGIEFNTPDGTYGLDTQRSGGSTMTLIIGAVALFFLTKK